MTPQRDPAYLAFVRAMPCVYCKRRPAGHAHHEGKRMGGGTALKGCDFHTVPLCAAHHAEYHQRGRIGFWTFETTQSKFTVSIERAQARWRLNAPT